MNISLINYLNKRLIEEEKSIKNSSVSPGPVITISRQVGCNGLKLAKLLTSELNSKKPPREWKVLSKEIIHASAGELNMTPEQVKKTMKQAEKSTFSEILKAFNEKNFKSERTITKTVIDTVLTFANEGNCIIIGRAGHIIAKDIKRALHLRLEAPFEYRIKTIMQNNQLTKKEAINFIEKVDKERDNFRKTVRDDIAHKELFDITLNRASFSDEEILEIIQCCIEKKKILE